MSFKLTKAIRELRGLSQVLSSWLLSNISLYREKTNSRPNCLINDCLGSKCTSLPAKNLKQGNNRMNLLARRQRRFRPMWRASKAAFGMSTTLLKTLCDRIDSVVQNFIWTRPVSLRNLIWLIGILCVVLAPLVARAFSDSRI